MSPATGDGAKNRSKLSLVLSFRRRLDLAMFAVAMLVVIASVVTDWRLNSQHEHGQYAIDLGTFYCAGATVGAHGDLYKTIPYDRCGNGNGFRPSRVGHRAPAPIPGYDVPIFEALAKLPFPAAAGLWFVVSVVAAIVGVLVVSSISKLPAIVVFLAIGNGFRESLSYGQLSPILFGALALAGFALSKDRFRLAAIAAIVCLIEPHVGIPVVVAMFAWAPRTRIMLAASTIALCALSVAVLGLAENIEYIRVVLPAQVLAEVPADGQYSFTWLLYFFGADEVTAVRVAEFQYAITVIAGIFAARTVARRIGSPALIPFVAGSFAVIGGPFIHLFQVGTIAVLAALVIAGRRNEPAAWIALLLVAASWDGNGAWLDRQWTIARFESALIVATFAMFAFRERKRVGRVAVGLAAAALFLFVTSAIVQTSLHQVRQLDSASQFLAKSPATQDYSTTQWGLYLRTSSQNPSREALFAKSPTWVGLLFLIVAVVRVTQTRTLVAQSASAPVTFERIPSNGLMVGMP